MMWHGVIHALTKILALQAGYWLLWMRIALILANSGRVSVKDLFFVILPHVMFVLLLSNALFLKVCNIKHFLFQQSNEVFHQDATSSERSMGPVYIVLRELFYREWN